MALDRWTMSGRWPVPKLYRQHKLESIGYKTTTTVLKEYEKI
jgi:DsbC/DsbD-like thiol-disulfide interchange protein